MTMSTQTASAGRAGADAFDVIPTGVALAAEVKGVDLRYLNDRMFGQLLDAG